MDLDEARHVLALCEGSEEPGTLPKSVLSKLTMDDLPENGSFQVGGARGNVIHLDWERTVFRVRDTIFGEADYLWTRKYWYSPLA
jgi:hypothetical protein